MTGMNSYGTEDESSRDCESGVCGILEHVKGLRHVNKYLVSAKSYDFVNL